MRDGNGSITPNTARQVNRCDDGIHGDCELRTTTAFTGRATCVAISWSTPTRRMLGNADARVANFAIDTQRHAVGVGHGTHHAEHAANGQSRATTGTSRDAECDNHVRQLPGTCGGALG